MSDESKVHQLSALFETFGKRFDREIFENFERNLGVSRRKSRSLEELPTGIKNHSKMNIKPTPFKEGIDNVAEWLTVFETIAEANNWDDPTKLLCLPCYLAGTPQKWFQAFKATYHSNSGQWSWEKIKEALLNSFGGTIQKQEWILKLTNRVQGPVEDSMYYIHDMVDLCRKVNQAMSELDKVQYVMAGLLTSTVEKVSLMDNSTMDKLKENVAKVDVAKFMTQQRMQRGNQAQHGQMNAVSDSVSSEVAKLTEQVASLANELQVQRAWLANGVNSQLNGFQQMSSPINLIQGDPRYNYAPAHYSGWQQQQQGYQQPDQGNNRRDQRGITGRVRCWNCGKLGHFARNCRSNQSQAQNGSNSLEPDNDKRPKNAEPQS